jgi:HEPN domain-containing protein
MDIEEVKEWFDIAYRDFDSAKILNVAVRKPYEIICYHCAQAVEKYLKGYLIYRDIIPQKTHDLSFLNGLCIEKDDNFSKVQQLCDFLTTFANDIRYPHKYEVTENDVNFSIQAVEKIENIKPLADLRAIILSLENKE